VYNLIKVVSIVNGWTSQVIIGKVTVVRIIALPILVQRLPVLPNPPYSVLNDIEEIFYTFLWNGRKDKFSIVFTN
jgi:hypothetical protein